MKTLQTVKNSACIKIALMSVLLLTAVAVQAFPDKPLRIIIPFVPGGATDQLGRLFAEKLSKSFGQQVIVENRPGANTILAADVVARAAPDGYTLFVAAGSTLVLNPLLYKKLPYDPDQDFRTLAILGEVPLVAVVPVAMPVNSLSEFVQYAKQQQGKLNYASVGTGSTLHLAGELFKQKSGINMTHVPYKGSTQALTDLVGGQVDLMLDAYSTAYPQIQSGKLRALGVTSRARLPTMSDIPTIAEFFPGFLSIVWYGMVVPKAVPDDIALQLQQAINHVFEDPLFKQTMINMGFVPGQAMTDLRIQEYISDEKTRWTSVIRDQNITLEN